MNLLREFDKIFPPKTAYAHCDIPCGIYDPHEAQLATHTVLRMTVLIDELSASSKEPLFAERKKIISEISRLTSVKDEQGEIVKREVRVIWGDYFKPEHLEKFPDIHDLVFQIMKSASKIKQKVDIEAANELILLVQKFSKIFWESKGRKTAMVQSGYPTGGEIVLPA